MIITKNVTDRNCYRICRFKLLLTEWLAQGHFSCSFLTAEENITHSQHPQILMHTQHFNMTCIKIESEVGWGLKRKGSMSCDKESRHETWGGGWKTNVFHFGLKKKKINDQNPTKHSADLLIGCFYFIILFLFYMINRDQNSYW